MAWLFSPQSQQLGRKGQIGSLGDSRSATLSSSKLFGKAAGEARVPRRRRPPLPVTEIPRRPCSVLGPRKPRSSSWASEGSALRRAALWNTEFNRKLGRERTPDPACVYLASGAGQGRADQDFVIKPRPDRRRHLRTWTSGRTLARVSVPQRGVRGTQNYSSHPFAVALRQWEPSPDSSLTLAQGSAPPSLCASPENRRALTSVPTGATEHPPSLLAGLTFFPHSVYVARETGSRLLLCLC